MSIAYQEAVLEIQNQVVFTDKTQPLTGVHSKDQNIAGWKYNRRIMPDSANEATRYLTNIGGHEVGLLDGTKLTHWQSGVSNGIEYAGIANMRVTNDLTWTPRYTTGAFSVYWDDRRLYSDYSFSENAISLSGGRTTLTLRSDAVENSINASLYKRLDSFQIVTFKEATLVDGFTGILSGGARTAIADGVPSDWTQVETRKYEMLVDGTPSVLYFNQDFGEQVGRDYINSTDLKQTWENKGAGLLESRPLFCTFFPIDPDSVELVSIDAAGTITTWTKQDNLNNSGPTDNHFSVNPDLGVINTGGYQAPDLVLADIVTLLDDEIVVVTSTDLSSYPETGYIQIDSEFIAYTGKTSNSFTGCTRGELSTTPALHNKGAIVSDRQHGAGTTDDWYVKYRAVPRVDYELTSYDLRTANYSSWLDIRSIVNVKPNNIVQIVSQDTNLSSIVLTTDADIIGGSLYGPMFFGLDTAKVTATGFDSAGNPVEDVDLTIEIESGPGKLNGSLSSYTSESNTSGEVSAFFNVPYDNEDAIIQVTNVQHVGSDTHVTIDTDATITPSEAWIFQILKHDPVLGTVGNKVAVESSGSVAGIGNYLDVYMVYTEDYNNGTILVENSTTGERRTVTIDWAEKKVDSSGEPYVRFFTTSQLAIPSWFGGSDPAWLFQEEAVTWDPVLKRGARVILYEWSTTALHPITDTAGAYMPLRPDAVQGNVLVFTNRLLPLPAPTDDNSNLGAYAVVAPAETTVSASGRDPFTGRLISSNKIRFRVQVPVTLTGVGTSGGLPVPYGWTLITESFNIGAGLDGANFITINPAATGINQFNITGVI